MSLFFSAAEYAEDQRFAKTILTMHVLDRGMQTGAIAGVGMGGILGLIRQRKANSLLSSPLTATTATTATATTAKSSMSSAAATASKSLSSNSVFARTLVSSTGVGMLAGLSLMAVSLPFYMRGKTEIEWQDRSWRLLHNKGQVEVDEWALIGEALGLSTLASTRINSAVGFAKTTSTKSVMLVNVVGRAGVGSVVGVLGYMVWRYGVRQGKRAGDEVLSTQSLKSVIPEKVMA